MKKVNLVGRRFGRLEVLGESTSPIYGNMIAWVCVCECGKVTKVAGGSLRRGLTKSCGCLRLNDHEIATYEAAHARVRTAKGPAKNYDCVDCRQPARHWSYDYRDPDPAICTRRDAEYSFDPARYEPRCVPCHKKFDGRAARRGLVTA